MNLFNTVTSALFAPLLAPFGAQRSWSAWLDVLVWSVAAGIAALLVYKAVSNQRGIARVKNQIKVHLLEIRLYQEDILGVLGSTGKILAKNALYIGHNLLPMVVMIVPMMAILVQLVATYAYAPLPEGSRVLLTAKLDRTASDLPARAVRLELPPGIELDAPPVRTAKGEIAWRLRLTEPGDHVVTLAAGDERVAKGIAVGGPPRRIPVLRTKGWEGFLYPAEPALPKGSALASVSLPYPTRKLSVLPDGEGGILVSFFVLSLAAGFALKGVFKVTL